MKILVVDDEPLAREAVLKVLQKREDVEAVSEAKDATEALSAVSDTHPDLMFLDIQMPGTSGVDFARELRRHGRQPRVVFVTAHDQFAVEAFEQEAVDYVLKPFSEARINQAVEAAKKRLDGERAIGIVSQLPQMIGSLAGAKARRIGIKSEGRILFVDPAEIIFIESQGKYVLLHGKTGSYLLREALGVVEQQMDGHDFVRIHRSTIVNCAYVQEVHPWFTGEYILKMKNGKEFTVTRKYKKNLGKIASVTMGVDLARN